MPYKFNFDLSRISRSFFRDVARFSHEKSIHRNMGKKARYLVKKFRIDKIIGIPVSDAIRLVEDMLDTCVLNLSMRDDFNETKHRALLLPHCSRKYMDSRCKAKFDPRMSSYHCNQCSKDCLVNRATSLAEERGYDVYVLPGGSCVRKVLRKKYDGLVGIACTEEIGLAKKLLRLTRIKAQGVPLIKNGCSHTKFKMETLRKVL
ncbi:MAG: DUF116 domain-containing protein [archaeon]|nr:MAG: DUF116 domain-containing protein [archaeon]